MVTVADLEGLFKKYIEENRFECADALYLCVELGKERASETLWLRYGMAAPLTSALSDVEKLGVKDLGRESTQDIGISISDAIVKIFEHICLGELVKRVESGVGRLSRLARAVLYLTVKFGGETIRNPLLAPLCEFIFQLRAGEKSLRRAFEELAAHYIFQHPDPYYAIPRFFDKLVPVLEDVLPKVEVKVTWPESK
ncbi:MAG: hypothetical protein QXX87_02700 [Candidatus Jordarchaeales archaeon]